MAGKKRPASPAPESKPSFVQETVANARAEEVQKLLGRIQASGYMLSQAFAQISKTGTVNLEDVLVIIGASAQAATAAGLATRVLKSFEVQAATPEELAKIAAADKQAQETGQQPGPGLIVTA